MTPRLSILCPALFSRRGVWPILDDLRGQCYGKPAELIVLMDDARISVGEKHNALVRCARGEYVSFVADDDAVAQDYVDSLLDAIGDTDVVSFLVDWGSIGWNVSDTKGKPLAAVRRSLIERFQFPDWWQSEDRAFATWLRSQNPTTRHIDRVLYTYHFRAAKPEYGGRMYPPQGKMASAAQVEQHVRGQG